MRLPDSVYDAVDQAGVQISYANAWMTSYWNRRRDKRLEPRFYCGWYWWRPTDPEDMQGPFRSRSAAYRDAYQRLQLRWAS